MKTEDIPNTHTSTWIPTTDPVVVSIMGKLIEEAGELMSIAGRILIQGMDGVDPETGVPNIVALEEEIADVTALNSLCVENFKLDVPGMYERAKRKQSMKQRWVDELRRDK